MQSAEPTYRNDISENGFLTRRREMILALKAKLIEAKGKGQGYYIHYRMLNPKTGKPLISPTTGKPKRTLKFTGKFKKSEAEDFLQLWYDDQFLNKQEKFKPHSVATALSDILNSKRGELEGDSLREIERSVRYFVEFIREETGEENFAIQLITYKHCNSFLQHIQSTISKHERNKHRTNLSGLWNKIVKDRDTYGVLENPFKLTDKVHIPQATPVQITEKEFRLLYDGMRTDTFQMKMYKLASAFSYYTGLRSKEICFLRSEFTTGNTIHVQNIDNFTTKSKKNRLVPITDKVKEVLMLVRVLKSQHKSDSVRNTEYLFCTDKGNHLIKSNLSKYFTENRKNILPNRTKVTFHALRRSYGQNLLNDVENSLEIKDLTLLYGHSSVGVTEKSYANSLSIPLEKIRKKIENSHAQTPSLERPSYQTPETEQYETDSFIITPYGVSVGAIA